MVGQLTRLRREPHLSVTRFAAQDLRAVHFARCLVFSRIGALCQSLGAPLPWPTEAVIGLEHPHAFVLRSATCATEALTILILPLRPALRTLVPHGQQGQHLHLIVGWPQLFPLAGVRVVLVVAPGDAQRLSDTLVFFWSHPVIQCSLCFPE